MIGIMKKIGTIAGFIGAFAVLLFAALFIVTCSGHKKDSLTVFLALNCTECHSSVTRFDVAGAKAGYDVSGHKLLGNSSYANGGGCQQCHTHEGFVEYTTNGKIDPKSFVASPSQPHCFTCHDPHGRGDFDRRTVASVTLENGGKFDAGNGNLCANCHRSRADAAKEVTPKEAKSLFAFFGPHHGPQADMFAGTNAFQFEGKTYANSAHTTVVKDSCTTCHMTRPDGRFGLAPGIGGHSFNIAGDVHETETINTAGCIACHTDMKQVKGTDMFDKKADEDYDLDGSIEPLQAEVQGLLDKLVNPAGTGILQRLSQPMFDKDGNWLMAKEGTRSLEQVAALFNYKFVHADRSNGIHNATYTIQVLYDSIAALDPKFDASRRPQ